MCFDSDSAPPVPPGPQRGVIDHRFTLTSRDGTEFAAFEAVPPDPTPVGVIVLPDVRGLYGFYVELARRFAENGHPAVVLDYYGRTGGVGERGDDFPVAEHMARLTPRGLHDDLTAVVAHLRAGPGQSERPVITIGFCLGGRLGILAGTEQAGHDLAGMIGFYCWPHLGPNGAPGPTARAAELTAPVLALMAGDDPDIPAAHVEEFETALTRAGLEHEVVSYPGAPHSFFDVKQGAHQTASVDAWNRVLAFIDRAAVRSMTRTER